MHNREVVSAALIVAAVWLSPSQAIAESFSTDVQGPAGCADGQVFGAEILMRAPSASLSERGRYAFRVRLNASRKGADGTLTVRRDRKVIATRRLDGASCTEVISAFALIAAVTLDPKARSEPVELLRQEPMAGSPTTSPSTELSSSAPSPGVAERDGTVTARATALEPESASKSAMPARHAVIAANRQKPTQLPCSTDPGSRLLFGVEAAWLSPIVPNGGFGGTITLGVRLKQGLQLRLALGALIPVTRGNAHGESARYSYLGGQLDLGGLLVTRRHWAIEADLRAKLGDLSVQAEETGRISRSVRSHAAFLAVGPALGITRFWHQVETSVVASLPIALNRPEFEIFVPAREVFSKTPLVGFELALIVAFSLEI